MISYKNATKLLFSQVQDTKLSQKSKASQSSADVQFKSIFDNALNTTKKQDKVEATKDNKENVQNADSNLKYKSFKEVKANKALAKKSDSVEKSKDLKAENIDSESKDLKDTSKVENDVINVLAQMLGMKPDELVKLANELGFSANDLQDTKKLAIFTEKLSSLLELNASQKAMLEMVTTEVSKQVNPNSETKLPEVSGEKVNEATENKAKFVSTEANELSKITQEVKQKLDQLIENAKFDKEAVATPIAKLIEAMNAQVKPVTINEMANTQESSELSATDEINSEEQITEKQNIIAEKKSEKAENGETKNSEDADGSSSSQVLVNNLSDNTQVASNGEIGQQEFQVIPDVKIGVSNLQTVEKATTAVQLPIKAAEVVNQVVEQAKVTIGQDKSEMVIQLRPDHLGKLELKVVTEQGIVAAKFIAESQQVKEIIESNMQLLKDSLQKQGISIEGISVQVGSDKQNQYQQQNSYQNKGNKSGDSKYSISNGSIVVNGINTNGLDNLPDRLAKYSNESNTINLTA